MPATHTLHLTCDTALRLGTPVGERTLYLVNETNRTISRLRGVGSPVLVHNLLSTHALAASTL
jgi:hypothetical protein